MDTDPYHLEIMQWLAGRGHSPDAVEKIMKRLQQYDTQMVRDALFDSIETGGFDIEAIIQEVLEESGDK